MRAETYLQFWGKAQGERPGEDSDALQAGGAIFHHHVNSSLAGALSTGRPDAGCRNRSHAAWRK